MAKIAVVGSAWLPRVLVRAQLKDEGHEVMGYDALSDVIAALRLGLLALDLLIVDTSGNGIDPRQLLELRKVIGVTSTLVLTGPFDAAVTDFKAMGFPNILVRPVLVRSVVQHANRLLDSAHRT